MIDIPTTWMGVAAILLAIIGGLLDRKTSKERDRREQEKIDELIRGDAVDGLDPNKLHNRTRRK